MTPKSETPAAQLREMGIGVGDTIRGKESYATGWHISKLKILFIGQTAVVFEYWSSNSRESEFRLIGEVTSWDLRHRNWIKEAKNEG